MTETNSAMKFHSCKKIFTLACFIATAFFVSAQVNEKDLPPRPNPPRLVNDFADVLSTSQEHALEQKLVAFDDSTSTQIAIVTLQSLNGRVISDYAFALGRYWGVGQKDFNNGVVILTSLQEHEVFIATGYGIEPTITDGRAKRIIEQDIIPQFKNGNYYAGFDAATDKIIAYTKGEFNAKDEEETGDPMSALAVIIIIIIILIIISRNNRNGGVTFGGMGPVFWGGGFGRGGGGGGFGGGGFGGFGGGSFGGGGAGGRW